MKCPNCGMEMVGKEYTYHGCYTGEEVTVSDFKCKKCKITYYKEVDFPCILEDEWNIPDKYKPTPKQIKTILFINNHLRKDIKALTKKQCWEDISKYF